MQIGIFSGYSVRGGFVGERRVSEGIIAGIVERWRCCVFGAC